VADREAQKRHAAERAVDYVRSGMRVGLGTGSTAWHVVNVIAERLDSGTLADIVGVPTSRATEAHARERGIPLATLEEVQRLDVTIDGADEIDPNLDLIKGLGGALLWEKIVASASERLVIVADDGKEVPRLGTRAPLPIEVIPFGWRTHLDFLRTQGGHAELRQGSDGSPFLTDGGHYILDCRFADGISDPAGLERALDGRVGIVESGLFLGMATATVIAGAAGVHVKERGTQ
jgi:ribose 5-phosphate isomerase A